MSAPAGTAGSRAPSPASAGAHSASRGAPPAGLAPPAGAVPPALPATEGTTARGKLLWMGWDFWLVECSSLFLFPFQGWDFFPFLHSFCSYLSGAAFYPPEAAHSRCDKWDFHGCRGRVAGRFSFLLSFQSKGFHNGRKSISKDVVTPAGLPGLSGISPTPPGDGGLGLPSRSRCGRSEHTGAPPLPSPASAGPWQGRGLLERHGAL